MREDYRAAVEEHGSIRAAARALGVPYTTLHDRLAKFPALPEGGEPVDELRARLRKNFQRRHARRQAELWLPLTLPEALPFGVVWFGDPHLGDDDCNLPLLEEHVRLCQRAGVYGAAVGDYSNNWVGRLLRLYGEQSTTKHAERELIKWFARDCGVDWRLWLVGNHDQFSDGEAILGLIVDQAHYVASWEAKVIFRTSLDEWKVHAAHSFPGQSMWNSNHGGLRKAKMNSPAELFVEGHTHNFGLQSFEKPGDGRVAHCVQTRGYKWHDEYAVVKGYEQVQSGASVMTIFNPLAQSAAGRITTFADIALGCDFLTFLRQEKTVKASAKTPAPKRKRKAKVNV